MKIFKYFIILFFFLSNSAQSNEWRLVYENSLNEDRVFIDISNIEKKIILFIFGICLVIKNSMIHINIGQLQHT